MKKDLKVVKWKQWYQVQYQGHTIEQFLSRSEAQAYIDITKSRYEPLQRVSQHFGQTIKHINIYP